MYSNIYPSTTHFADACSPRNVVSIFARPCRRYTRTRATHTSFARSHASTTPLTIPARVHPLSFALVVTHAHGCSIAQSDLLSRALFRSPSFSLACASSPSPSPSPSLLLPPHLSCKPLLYPPPLMPPPVSS